MNEALSSGAVDVIGLARPLCTEASQLAMSHGFIESTEAGPCFGLGFKGSWSLVVGAPGSGGQCVALTERHLYASVVLRG